MGQLVNQSYEYKDIDCTTHWRNLMIQVVLVTVDGMVIVINAVSVFAAIAQAQEEGYRIISAQQR